MEDKKPVELAFLEKVEPSTLPSFQFPSKVGGNPSWLSLSPIPSNKDLECSKCGKILSFLLQVYCPIDNKATAFHRTVFVFICRNASCYEKNSNLNFCVLRSQLPRENEFYSSQPPKEGILDGPSVDLYHDICIVCGLQGPKKCSRCHSMTYCSKEHQHADWKKRHKDVCKEGYSNKGTLRKEEIYPGIHFPIYELITEPEIISKEKDREKNEEEKLKEYEEFMKSEKAKSVLPDSESKDLEKMAAKEESQDLVFLRFKERIKDEPEQVLRYQRNGQPLWVSNEHISTEGDIPKCSCGAKRTFEFQIMPQLLTYLDVDSLGNSIDWGTLCVYTCSDSCDIGNKYNKEFVWKQDYSDSNL